MKLRIRAAGCQDFDIEVGPDATIAEVKVEATAGCDIDPDAMKLIHRGKVLKDDDTLQACGIDGTQPLHVARGRPAAAAADPTPKKEPVSENSSSGYSDAVQVILKGPSGSEVPLQVSNGELIAQTRARAAALFDLKADDIHLVLRGKLLKDEDAPLTVSGLSVGDVLRVARRAAPAAPSLVLGGSGPAPMAVEADTTARAGGIGVAMPNAFGTAQPTNMQQIHTLFAQGAANGGAPLDLEAAMQVERQLAAIQMRQQMAAEQVPVEVRLPREVRAMGHQVRLIVAERQGVDVNDIAEDEELMDHIALTMAQARARGACVPDPVSFINRALDRGEQARATSARLNREAHGMDPELEDALMAAEEVTAAAAKAPKRLGRE